MAKYVWQVKYLEDPTVDVLPVNYEIAFKQHQAMRLNFARLTRETKDKFNKRSTSGVPKGYWRIVVVEDLKKMGQPDSGPHFLPSGYVLKPQTS